MAVWTGYTNRMTPILDNSMRIASDVYHNMMTFMHSDYTATDWEVPSGVVNFGGNYYLRDSSSLKNAYINYYNSLPQSSSSSSTSSSSTSSSSTSSSSSSSTPASGTHDNGTQTETSTSDGTSTSDTSSNQQNNGNTENTNQ